EPTLGLHHIAEQTDDVPILAIELKLHLGLVLLQVLRTHLRARFRQHSPVVVCSVLSEIHHASRNGLLYPVEQISFAESVTVPDGEHPLGGHEGPPNRRRSRPRRRSRGPPRSRPGRTAR